MSVGALSRLTGARDAGVPCFAHVIRRRPADAASFFTSLRRAPRRPAQAALLQFCGRKVEAYSARVMGGRRSEVKEERRAQPGAGDTSSGGLPSPLARTKQQWSH